MNLSTLQLNFERKDIYLFIKGLLNKRDWYLTGILLVLCIIFFAPILFTDITFADRLFSKYSYPMRVFASQSIKEGCFPLWNPYIFSGYPFFANIQSALSNPFSILTYLLPFQFGFKLFFIIQVLLSGISMYLLIRDWGLRGISCMVSAIIYMFSSFSLSVDLLTQEPWIPLIFFLFNRALKRKSYRYAISTGIVIAFQLLGLFPEISYMSLLTLILFTITSSFKERNFSLKPFFFLLIAILIGLGISAFQSVPFIELVLHSSRGGKMLYSQVSICSLSFPELLGFFLPISPGIYPEPLLFWVGQDWLKSNYIGGLATGVAFIGFFSKRNLLWKFLLCFSIILSVGAHLPTYRLLYEYLPGISSFRFPVKFFYLTIFSFAILTGVGVERILQKKCLPIFLFGIGYILLLLVGIVFEKDLLLLLQTRYFPDITELFGMKTEYNEILLNSLFTCSLLWLGVLLVFLYKKDKIKTYMLEFCLISIIILDTFIFSTNLNPLVREDFYQYESNASKFLKEKKGCFRIIHIPELLAEMDKHYYLMQGKMLPIKLRYAQDFLIPNFGLIYHISDVNGDNVLRLQRYKTLLHIIKDAPLRYPSLLDMLNVKYIIADKKIPSPRLKLVYQEGGVMIYENLSCLPRAFLIPQAKVIKEEAKILEELTNPKFDSRKEVIIEQEISSQGSNSEVKPQLNRWTKIINYEFNNVTIAVSSPTNSFLFLSDTYYPGWKVFVDGDEREIYCANFAFRVVYLSPGNHLIEFKYIPMSLIIGGIITIITLFVSLWLLTGLRKKQSGLSIGRL
ncbi:MAG: YfhO family protein [bacterium]